MTGEQREMIRALRDVQVKYELLLAEARLRADGYAATIARRDQQIARLSARLSRLTEKLALRAQANAELRVTVRNLTVRTVDLESQVAAERMVGDRLGEAVARLERKMALGEPGVPGAVLSRAHADLEERFWSKVRLDVDGCWTWTGSMTRHGFARIGVNGKTEDAHRVAFRVVLRDVPARLRRGCANQACVNPDHWISTAGGRTNLEGRSAPAGTGGES